MRYSLEHKEETRRKILDAAARRFRAQGYDGLGVDGLAKEAGVTNGAFYNHFSSKAQAFRDIVVRGLADLRQGILGFQAKGGNWVRDFAVFYFSDRKIDCPEEACALPAFAPEAARAPAETREAFQAELLKVVDAVEAGLKPRVPNAEERAWVLLALLTGGVTLLRAIPDKALAADVSRILEEAASALGPAD